MSAKVDSARELRPRIHSIESPRRGGASGTLRERGRENDLRDAIRMAQVIMGVDTQDCGRTEIFFRELPASGADQESCQTAEVLSVPVDYFTDDADILVQLCLELKGSCEFGGNRRTQALTIGMIPIGECDPAGDGRPRRTVALPRH
jgi:hypothetical protein